MGLFDPQGISSSPSSQQITNSGISAWAQPYVMNYLNQGNALLNQGPTESQQQVWNTAQNMQTPGQFAQGSDLLNQSGAGLLGTTGTALGYGQQAAGAGQNYANMATDPRSVAAYMSPYIQQSLAPQLQMLNQQQALAGQGINAKAVGQGAFGGNRATLAQGLNAQNYDLARQQAIGQGYDTAFKQAQQAQQFGSSLGLQGLQTGLQGVNAAQQGYQGATQAGVGLGNIGAQQSQADVARLGLQNTIANQQYNLPFQRLNFMQGLMSGLPVSSSTTQGYTAGQNPYLQGIGAVGTVASYAPKLIDAGKSVYNFVKGIGGNNGFDDVSTADIMSGNFAEGGEVQRYAEGGIASINRKVMNDPTAYSEQTVNRGAQDNVLGGVTKLLALDTIAKQRAAMQAQQAMQQQPQPPVYQQLAQQAMPPQGVDSAQSNLPQQYAGGGIIAFEEGGDVPKDPWGESLVKWWKSHTLGSPEALQRQGAITPEQAVTANQRQADIAQRVQEGRDKYFAGALDKPDELGRYKAGADSGIVIHDNAPRNAGISAAPSVAAPAYRPADTSGIDTLRTRYEDMIRGGEDFKQSEKQAETNAMRNLFLNMMNPEKGASFVAGLGGAGQKAQAGLEKAQEELQTRKDKQIGQLVALGLKGEDLKNAARKIGIDETELQGKLPLYAAQAGYYNTAKGKGGAGAGLGSIGAATTDKVLERFDEFRRDYKNPNNPYVAMLSPQDQLYLQKGSGKSLANARQKLNDLIDMEQQRRLNTLAGYSAKRPVSQD